MKELRKGAGLTQVQLAERLSLDQSYVSKIERGERYVDVLLYIDWCLSCKVPPSAAIEYLESRAARQADEAERIVIPTQSTSEPANQPIKRASEPTKSK